MKKHLFSSGLLLILCSTFGCSNTAELAKNTNDKGDSQPALSIEVGSFSSDQLFAAGGGGCGMILWQANTTNDEYLFFNGIAENSALMLLDGKITKLNRIDSTGKEFYGQYTEQTFTTEDSSLSIKVSVALGEPGEIESVGIPHGELSLFQKEQTKRIAVKGDAGC